MSSAVALILLAAIILLIAGVAIWSRTGETKGKSVDSTGATSTGGSGGSDA
jgi:hypothetical protein